MIFAVYLRSSSHRIVEAFKCTDATTFGDDDAVSDLYRRADTPALGLRESPGLPGC